MEIIPQAVVISHRTIINLTVTGCIFLTVAWNLVSQDRNQYHFFLFSRETLTKAEYLDYLLSRVIYTLLVLLICRYSGSKYQPNPIFFYLWVGYLIDFVLNFNEADYHLWILPISYTSIAGLIMLTITAYEFFTERVA